MLLKVEMMVEGQMPLNNVMVVMWVEVCWVDVVEGGDGGGVDAAE